MVRDGSWRPVTRAPVTRWAVAISGAGRRLLTAAAERLAQAAGAAAVRPATPARLAAPVIPATPMSRDLAKRILTPGMDGLSLDGLGHSDLFRRLRPLRYADG